MNELSSSSPCTPQTDIEKPTPFAGHSRSILAISYSPDGKQIATAGRDPSIRLWDSNTGELILEPGGHASHALCICYSPDGKRLVSGYFDGRVCIWNTCDGRLVIERVESHLRVMAVAYSPDGQCIATGDNHGGVQILRAEDMTPTKRILKHPENIYTVSFSPDGRRLATCSDDKIRIFDIETGTLIVGPLEGHTDLVYAVMYSPDSEQLASCSSDRTIRIWDAFTGHALLGPLDGHFDIVRCMTYSPDGKKLLSGSNDRTVRLWDSETGRLIGGPFKGHHSYITAVGFAPDGTQFITGAFDGSMRLWDAQTHEILSPELVDDEMERYRLVGPFRGHTGEIKAVACFPDGQRVASASTDNAVRIWDVHTGKLLVGPLIGCYAVQSIAISSDGSRLVSGAGNTITIWDTRTGDVVPVKLEGHSSTVLVLCVRFSPDDQFIASSDSVGQVFLWDSETGEQIRLMKGHKGSVWTLSFSPDGSQLAGGGGDRSILVWDVSTAKMLASPFQGHSGTVRSVSFSPDGLRIVSGSSDAMVRVWDAKTGASVFELLKAHLGEVTSVSYSPDGMKICSTSSDGTMCLWHATTGDLAVGPLYANKWAIRTAAFLPDGKRIVTGSDDCTMKCWDTTGKTVDFPDHENPQDSSFLDLPATFVPGHSQRVQEILLGSPTGFPATIESQNVYGPTSGPSQDSRLAPTTFFSFTRLRNAIANIFSISRPGPHGIELQERHHRPLRVANAVMKDFVVVVETSQPRSQALRDVSDDGSASDPSESARQRGNDGEDPVGPQGKNDAVALATQRDQDTSDATPQTRHEDDHGTVSMERSAPYSAAPRMMFATESIKSEDSFEVDCCACCPSWCTCLHP